MVNVVGEGLALVTGFKTAHAVVVAVVEGDAEVEASEKAVEIQRLLVELHCHLELGEAERLVEKASVTGVVIDYVLCCAF